MKNLTYKVVDTMKKNKDTIANQVTDLDMLNVCTTIKTIGTTHIAVAMPQDFNAAYIANGTTPSPRTAEAHIVKWFQTIHQLNQKVLFRGTYCAMENIYNFPYDKAATPQGTLASAPTDGTTTWLGKHFVFLQTLGYLWQKGDIYAPDPEQTSYVFNGNSFLSSGGAGIQANYSQFFRDLQDVANNVFNNLPSSTNLVLNPNFYSNVNFWSLDSDYMLTNDESLYGGWAVHQVSNGLFANFNTANDGTGIVVVPGQTYTASFYAKIKVTSGAAPIAVINQGSAFGTTCGSIILSDTGGVWKRFWVTFAPGVGNVFFRIFNNGGNVIASYAAFQLEKGNQLTLYFDGNQGQGYHWTGTVGNSTSTRDATTKGIGVNVGFTTNNYSEVRSGWLDNAICTKAGQIAYDYYGNYNNEGYNPLGAYVFDAQTVYTARGNLPIFQQEWGDLYTQTWADRDRALYVSYFYQAYTEQLINTGQMIGFNYWGGWEGQNTSILFKDGEGNYTLNNRGVALQYWFNNDTPGGLLF